jgi:hypothetical protein
MFNPDRATDIPFEHNEKLAADIVRKVGLNKLN